MTWNPFNLGNLRGRRVAQKKKSVGVVSYDTFDAEDKPVRKHLLPRDRRVTAPPRGDGYDNVRIAAAEQKRNRRKYRNFNLVKAGGFHE